MFISIIGSFFYKFGTTYFIPLEEDRTPIARVAIAFTDQGPFTEKEIVVDMTSAKTASKHVRIFFIQ